MQTLAGLPKYSSEPQSAVFCAVACAFNRTNLLMREGNPQFLQSMISLLQQFDPRYYKLREFLDFNVSDIYCYRSSISYLIRLFGERKEEYEIIVEKYRGLIVKKPGYKALVISEYLYENNRLSEALPYLLEAMEEARSALCMGALVPALADIARVRRAAGDYAGAFKTLEECRLLLQESGKLHWNQMVSALRCRLSIDSGDTARAYQWLSSCRIDIYAEISRIREFEFIVYARALLMKGLEQDAEILLQRLLAFMERANRLHSRVEVLNLLATLSCQRGEQSKAYAYLDCSLTIGREQGYIRSYLDEGKAMADIMAAYLKDPTVGNNKANAEFAAALLQRIWLEQPSAALGDGFLDCLTPREREVLSLLTEAYSNKEISEQMGVTLQAIKYHLGNIYGKLGVKNRAQCLKLVREHSRQKN
jgi:LuxR family maltose regulon positive regulatory protein